MKKVNTLIFTLLTALSLFAQVGRELYRPIFHFSPNYNWMNDPNGLVYYNGTYHLFYQYNPLGSIWGNMSWGHAISADLINWEEKPVAIPMQNGIMAFSGSVVVDWKNTSGFGVNGKPPLVAIYTGSHTVQDQRIAYSNDEGLTWTNYSGNPVLTSNNKQFRDPKVFWHEESQNWVMIVGLGFNIKIGFYKSPDLKNWTYFSSFGPAEHIYGFWECPDLFKLNVDDDPNKAKWVLINSFPSKDYTQYFIGDFDGERFSWTSPPPPGIVIDDFESNNYNDWIVTGTAFGQSPAPGNLSTQKVVSGYLGNKLINSFYNGTESTGKMISPDFTIQKKFISFLIGGGNYSNGTYVKLIVDGQTVKTSTGENDDYLKWKNWNVEKWLGKTARIEIVDSITVATGLGYILIDQIMQSDVMVNKINTGQIDHGYDFYAPQSYSDIPASDGRRIWMAWLNNWNYANALPTKPWKGIMTIPREVKLETHNGQIKLVQKPVEELDRLHKNVVSFSNKDIASINDALNVVGNNNLLNNSSFKQFELKARLAVSEQKGFSLKFKKRGLQYTEYIFDFENREIRFNRARSGAMSSDGNFRTVQTAPLIIEDGYFDFRLFVDNCSAELFTAGGQVVMTNQIFPDSTSNRVELSALGADINFEQFEIWRLDKNVSNTGNSQVDGLLFTVYPNPIMNSNGLTIKIKNEKMGAVAFKLIDASGKIITRFQPTTNSMILPRNKMSLNKGLYFLTGSDGITIQTEKLLILAH